MLLSTELTKRFLREVYLTGMTIAGSSVGKPCKGIFRIWARQQRSGAQSLTVARRRDANRWMFYGVF